jgi:hypothetical protein
MAITAFFLSRYRLFSPIFLSLRLCLRNRTHFFWCRAERGREIMGDKTTDGLTIFRILLTYFVLRIRISCSGKWDHSSAVWVQPDDYTYISTTHPLILLSISIFEIRTSSSHLIVCKIFNKLRLWLLRFAFLSQLPLVNQHHPQ